MDSDYPDAAANTVAAAFPDERKLFNGGTEFFRDGCGRAQIAVLQNHTKFIAPKTGEDVALPNAAPYGAGDKP